MDELLLSVGIGCYVPRLVMAEDVTKVWVEGDAMAGVGGGGAGMTGKTRPYGSLDRLLSPLRKRKVREEWAVRDIAIFQLGICQHGKDFHQIRRMVQHSPHSQGGDVCSCRLHSPFFVLCVVRGGVGE